MKHSADWIYQVLLLVLFPLFAGYFLCRWISDPLYRVGFLQRVGRFPDPFFTGLSGRAVFWVHAVSVGEVQTSALFVRRLRERYPEAALVFSTVTPMGMQVARQKLQEVDRFFYLPLDMISICRAVVNRFSPSIFIVLETEIWPNLLRALSERGIPVILINGRISDGAYRRYRLIRPFFSGVLQRISLLLMQSDRDAEKIRSLGASRVEVTGNMKYDQAGSGLFLEEDLAGDARLAGVAPFAGDARLAGAAPLRAGLGLSPEEIVFVAGSTHAGEEEALLLTFSTLTKILGPLVMFIAPRHLHRLDEIERRLLNRGYAPHRKTAGTLKGAGRPAIVLLDTMGELDQLYSIAQFVFVGGSLVPAGGHNLLEPAVFRKPVFFGPHMANFREIADQMKQSGGGIEVSDGNDLALQMAVLSNDPDLFIKKGDAAYQVVMNHRGAVSRNLDRVIQCLEK